MKLFSERYNYIKVSSVIIREKITLEIQNAICSCYDRLKRFFEEDNTYSYGYNPYIDMEKYLWTKFLNQREGNFYKGGIYHHIVATQFIEDKNNPWYRKLDLIELTIKYLYELDTNYNRSISIFYLFVDLLNSEFKRLNFAYRIVNTEIVEITSDEEIVAVESSMQNSPQNIRTHLKKALELYAQRPNGDYQNSIKESISAVEAYCRKITKEKTLGEALNKINGEGLIIPQILKVAFEKLYAYTNHPDTGIRHALMDKTGSYTPASEEAWFMLVSCSSFINYLNKKLK